MLLYEKMVDTHVALELSAKSVYMLQENMRMLWSNYMGTRGYVCVFCMDGEIHRVALGP